MNFVKKLASGDLYLVLGTHSGLDCYYYVRFKPGKLEEFRQLPPDTEMNITDFGEVVERGYGEPPN